MGIPIYQVDAFTDTPFKGNPAAVCVLDSEADAQWMQNLAAEMNLSETAFVRPVENKWELRWFTPITEVPLCGHATLASAHLLWDSGRADEDAPIVFRTLKSGKLTCVKRDGWISMDFPKDVPEPRDPPKGMLDALRVASHAVSHCRFHWLVELPDKESVLSVSPDFAALSRVVDCSVCVTSVSDDGDPYDFVSRYFAPWAGIDEDPVTGSAHCYLGPYWTQRFGRDQIIGLQASKRSGIVKMHVRDTRVDISGQAVTVFAGELR